MVVYTHVLHVELVGIKMIMVVAHNAQQVQPDVLQMVFNYLSTVVTLVIIQVAQTMLVLVQLAQPIV